VPGPKLERHSRPQQGAKAGDFAHDSGEGGFSPYRRENGGDIIWEIGSGYFGARNPAGTFSSERFVETAALDQVKMVELKISQGAKPGHAAGRQGPGGDFANPRRADGARLHIAVQSFVFLDAGRNDGVHIRDAVGCRASSRPI
jgi:Conserved region in glutamate synthase